MSPASTPTHVAALLADDRFTIIEHDDLTTALLFEGVEYRGEFDNVEAAQAHVQQVIEARMGARS